MQCRGVVQCRWSERCNPHSEERCDPEVVCRIEAASYLLTLPMASDAWTWAADVPLRSNSNQRRDRILLEQRAGVLCR